MHVMELSKMSGAKSLLPVGPAGLCFNRDEFMKDDFSIDRFVAECRRNVPLETLREDLGIYMRLLRTAMVELINQDYADFLNLSSNLVGLEKAIGDLSSPLNQLQQEVSSVKSDVDKVVSQIGQKLEKLKRIREQKKCLQFVMNSVQCVNRLENQMKLDTDDDNKRDVKLNGDVMERMSIEFNRLQFMVMKSEGVPEIEELKPKIHRFTNILKRNLEEVFLSAYQNKDLNGLRQCLRIYATMNLTREAEDVFRKKIIAIKLENVISDSVWKNHPQGLRGMYSKVLDVIRSHCLEVRSTTQPKYCTEATVVGFDFLVNAVWPEIVWAVETRTPLLCDLTNPKTFHERYLISLEFLDRFEAECATAACIANLRKHSSYADFLGRWNLAVYFQIRFQEIAGTLEASLSRPPQVIGVELGSEYLLPQTRTLAQCVTTCWSDDVYLRPLVHRFWKLTMLLWSRYAVFASDSIQAISHHSETVETNGSSQQIDRTPRNGFSCKDSKDFVLAIVALVADIHSLQKHIPEYARDVIIPRLGFSSDDKQDIIQNCIADTLKSFDELLPRIDEVVTKEVTSQAIGNLKLVNDIPRLFRRTNREVPTNPSAYVGSVLKPVESFLRDHAQVVPSTRLHAWTTILVERLTKQYLTLVSDVLTSVKKMEDSLKRFKMARDNKTNVTATSQSSSSSAPSGTNMSDDDKIRTQLAIDVRYFCTQVCQLGVDVDEVASLQELTDLAEFVRHPSPS